MARNIQRRRMIVVKLEMMVVELAVSRGGGGIVGFSGLALRGEIEVGLRSFDIASRSAITAM